MQTKKKHLFNCKLKFQRKLNVKRPVKFQVFSQPREINTRPREINTHPREINDYFRNSFRRFQNKTNKIHMNALII